MHASFLKATSLVVSVLFSPFIPARTQAAPADSVITIVTIWRPDYCRPDLLTAADSVRERARIANARFLREQPTRPVRPVRTTPAYQAPNLASGEAVDPTELQTRARLRREEEQRQIQQALPKWARRKAKAGRREDAHRPK